MKRLIEPDNDDLSLTRQAKLLNISRANLYYQPVINHQDVVAMNALDTIYTDYPFYGSRRIRYELNAMYHITICRDHVRRLMRLMGPGSDLSQEIQGIERSGRSTQEISAPTHPYDHEFSESRLGY